MQRLVGFAARERPRQRLTVFSFPVRDAGKGEKRREGGGKNERLSKPMRYGGMPTPFRQKASPLSARYANGSRVGERTAVRNKEAPRYDRSHGPDNAR